MSSAVYRVKKAQRIDAIFKRIQQGTREIQKLLNLDPQQTMSDNQIDSTVNQYNKNNYVFMVRHDPDIIGLIIIFRHLINTYYHEYGNYIISVGNDKYANAQGLYMRYTDVMNRLDTYFFGQPQTDTISRTRLFTTFRAYEIAMEVKKSD